jgi:hypothetical protein
MPADAMTLARIGTLATVTAADGSLKRDCIDPSTLSDRSDRFGSR